MDCYCINGLSIYSTWIVIVLRGCKGAFLFDYWFDLYSLMGLWMCKYIKFIWQEVGVDSLILRWYSCYLFYDGAVDMQIWALLTRSQCSFFDTQVTIKARGPLVYTELTKTISKYLFRTERQEIRKRGFQETRRNSCYLKKK